LDNAAKFHSRALRMGCSKYGIELMYRPVGRPHFGGHGFTMAEDSLSHLHVSARAGALQDDRAPWR
jgi:hypothetical protein